MSSVSSAPERRKQSGSISPALAPAVPLLPSAFTQTLLGAAPTEEPRGRGLREMPPPRRKHCSVHPERGALAPWDVGDPMTNEEGKMPSGGRFAR